MSKRSAAASIRPAISATGPSTIVSQQPHGLVSEHRRQW
jgi:hypothetical protein